MTRSQLCLKSEKHYLPISATIYVCHSISWDRLQRYKQAGCHYWNDVLHLFGSSVFYQLPFHSCVKQSLVK